MLFYTFTLRLVYISTPTFFSEVCIAIQNSVHGTCPQNHPAFCTLPWMKFEQCLFLVEHKSHNFCHVPSIQYDFAFMNGIQFSRWDFPPKLCKFQVWFWSREHLVFGFKMLQIWNTSSLSKTLLRCTPPDVYIVPLVQHFVEKDIHPKREGRSLLRISPDHRKGVSKIPRTWWAYK